MKFFLRPFSLEIDWEPPDVGLAPTGVWRVPPPHPPLQLEDPSLKPKPFPPRPLPPSSPHPPWLFLQCSGSPGRGGPVWCGGRGPGGRALQRYLGPKPTSGGTQIEGRKSAKKFRQNFAAFFADLFEEFRKNFALWDCGHNFNSVQTRCIVKGEAQKSPLFWRFSGGFLIFSGSPTL